jgi:hypothetical protein
MSSTIAPRPPDSYYRTTDRFTAAFLITRRAPFRGTEMDERNKVHFRFAGSNEINDHLIDFATDGEVSAKTYAEAIRFIDNQLHQARRNQQNGGQQ